MRSDINSIECKNCGNEFSGNFCNHCGQTAATNKVDATFIYEDLKKTFIQFNSGFFFTLKKMFLNPGGFMEQYLQGKRIHYTKPFAFLIITCGLNVLLYHYLHVDIVLNAIEGIDAKQSNDFIFDHYVQIQLLILPVYAAVSVLFFGQKTYNFLNLLSSIRS